MLEFEKKVSNFIKANELFSSVNKVLLAVSGGADSIALVYTMRELTTKNVVGAEMFCAHINHQLRRAEADLDEDFVITQSAKLKVPVTTKRIDVRGFARANKLSIEMAARKLRIEALLDIAKVNSCDCIVTGHQKNDNAETVLQRLARGTGFRGLGGIWPMRAFDGKIKFIRPLLCVTRDEILNYLKERNLQWRVDHTNADCAYRRNYIRHRLLPALQQDCTGSIVEQLSELAQVTRKFYELLCNRADKAWARLADCADYKVVLSLEGVLAEPPAVKVELIRRSLTAIGSGERDLTQKHYENILRLAEQNVSGKKIELPDRFTVQREYENLIFTRSALTEGQQTRDEGRGMGDEGRVKIPGRIRFGRYLIQATVLEEKPHVKRGTKPVSSRVERYSASSFTGGSIWQFVERFDLEKIELPLLVRFRKAGDKFTPLGLPAEKKVGKFLTSARAPHEVRRRILIVADREKIIWVWPIRISEQAKIAGETQKILQLQITSEHFVGLKKGKT